METLGRQLEHILCVLSSPDCTSLHSSPACLNIRYEIHVWVTLLETNALLPALFCSPVHPPLPGGSEAIPFSSHALNISLFFHHAVLFILVIIRYGDTGQSLWVGRVEYITEVYIQANTPGPKYTDEIVSLEFWELYLLLKHKGIDLLIL